MGKVEEPASYIEFFGGGPMDGEIVRIRDKIPDYNVPLGKGTEILLRVQRYVRTNLKSTNPDTGEVKRFPGMLYSGEQDLDTKR